MCVWVGCGVGVGGPQLQYNYYVHNGNRHKAVNQHLPLSHLSVIISTTMQLLISALKGHFSQR